MKIHSIDQVYWLYQMKYICRFAAAYHCNMLRKVLGAESRDWIVKSK